MSQIITIKAADGGLPELPGGDVLVIRGRQNELQPAMLDDLGSRYRTVIFQDADTLELGLLKSNLGLMVDSVDVS